MLFFRAVRDAHDDPFFPCSWPVAVVWVVWNWREVRSFYGEPGMWCRLRDGWSLVPIAWPRLPRVFRLFAAIELAWVDRRQYR